MLSAKFSAKQVCQNLGVTKETLRHYEQVGLLHPNINPDNGYREYGYWDVVTIIDILKYRSMEFSLSEIKSALYSLDFSEIVTMLETRADYYANLISKYKLLLNKSKRDFPLLLNARDHPGEIFETDIIDLVFIPFAMAESGGGGEVCPIEANCLSQCCYVFDSALHRCSSRSGILWFCHRKELCEGSQNQPRNHNPTIPYSMSIY